MNLTIDKFLNLLTPFVIIWVIIYIVYSFLFFFLPQTSIEYVPQKKVFIDYKNYDMSALFKQNPSEKRSANVVLNQASLPSLTGYELLAIYAKNSGAGWISIKDKTSQKTVTLKTGQMFKGYLLKRIFSSYAVFENAGREYKLQMKQRNTKFEIIKSSQSQNWKEKILIDGNTIQVHKKFFDTYVNDFERAWKSAEVQLLQNRAINGYLLTKIAEDSLLLSLGLKQNDIINKINGMSLNNYEDVFKLYKKIKTMDKLEMTIYRHNKLVELTYEIN